MRDAIRDCINSAHCSGCKYNKKGECLAKIDGYYPSELEEYYWLCVDTPELAKALYTNEEIEL